MPDAISIVARRCWLGIDYFYFLHALYFDFLAVIYLLLYSISILVLILFVVLLWRFPQRLHKCARGTRDALVVVAPIFLVLASFLAFFIDLFILSSPFILVSPSYQPYIQPCSAPFLNPYFVPPLILSVVAMSSSYWWPLFLHHFHCATDSGYIS